MTLPSIVVGNRTGGQGKTLISQLIHYGYKLSDTEMKTVSADSVEDHAISKLGSLIPGTVELGIGASLADVKANHHVAVAYWDRFGSIIRNGGCVIDLGANVLPMVFQWARERNAGRLLAKRDIHLVLPVTVQRQSLMDGEAVIETVLENIKVFPVSKVFLVKNDYQGQFNGDALIERVLRRLESEKFEYSVINLEKANVEVWDLIESNGTSIEKLMNMSFEDYMNEFSISDFAASGAEMAMKSWVFETLRAFQDVDLVPASDENLITEEAIDHLLIKDKASASAS